MKYIKTDNTNFIYKFNDDADYMQYDNIKGHIVKVADTIEELCDEFVCVDNTCVNGHQLLRAIPYKCASYWNGGVYGAIWTSKGLIYVAKMNEKGELELL